MDNPIASELQLRVNPQPAGAGGIRRWHAHPARDSRARRPCHLWQTAPVLNNPCRKTLFALLWPPCCCLLTTLAERLSTYVRRNGSFPYPSVPLAGPGWTGTASATTWPATHPGSNHERFTGTFGCWSNRTGKRRARTAVAFA